MKKRIVCIVIGILLLSGLPCSATSPSVTYKDVLKGILIENYWESMAQCYEVYEFLEDGTGYLYELSPAYYEVDREGLAHTLRHGPDESCIRNFQYQIQGNRVVITREDFKVTVSYVSKNSAIEWDLGVINHLPDGENFFYEEGFQPDELGLSSPIYFKNTHLATGRDYAPKPGLPTPTPQDVTHTEEPADEVIDIPDVTVFVPDDTIGTPDIIGQIQAFFDSLFQWIASIADSIFTNFIW